MAEQEPRFLKHTVKDSVFSKVFSLPENQVDLLRALYPDEETITEDDIQDVTIENVVVADVYNDLGLLFRDKLVVLVEVQSTWTANILVRLIEYVARSYKDHMAKTKQNWYGTKKVQIPRVDLYVVYVGSKKLPEGITYIDLAEEFFGGNPCSINVRAKVISDPMGRDMLSQYMEFAKVSDEVTGKYGNTRESAQEIIRECISRDILTAFLESRKEEVLAAMVELFSQREALEMTMASERYAFEQKGKIDTLLSLVAEGLLPLNIAAQKAGMTEDTMDEQVRAAFPEYKGLKQ